MNFEIKNKKMCPRSLGHMFKHRYDPLHQKEHGDF